MAFPRARSESSAEEEKRSVEKETISQSEIPELRVAAKPRLPVSWRVLVLVLTCLCSCEFVCFPHVFVFKKLKRRIVGNHWSNVRTPSDTDSFGSC